MNLTVKDLTPLAKKNTIFETTLLIGKSDFKLRGLKAAVLTKNFIYEQIRCSVGFQIFPSIILYN